MRQKATANRRSKHALASASIKPTELEAEMAKSPKASVEMLSADFKRIKAQYIDKGEFTWALADMENSIFVADFEKFKPLIKGGVRMGTPFIAKVESLLKALREGGKDSIEFHSRALLVHIRQMELRENCLRK
jgi:hypothetical protein